MPTLHRNTAIRFYGFEANTLVEMSKRLDENPLIALFEDYICDLEALPDLDPVFWINGYREHCCLNEFIVNID